MNHDEYSVPVYFGSSSDPVVRVSVPDTWGWPSGELDLHVPSGAMPSGGADGELTIVNGTTAYDFWIWLWDGPTTAAHAGLGQERHRDR